MTVQVKFLESRSFHAGEFKSLDLDKISRFQITRQSKKIAPVFLDPVQLPMSRSV